MYIRRELQAEEVKINTKFQENMWVTVKLNNKDKIIIGCIYKSPNSSQENLDALKDLIRNIAQPNKEHSHLLIMGDFIYNKIDWNQWTMKTIGRGKRIRDSYLLQHVNTITRSRENSKPSMLDLILTNEEEMIDNLHVMDPLGHSDHCVMEF